MSNSEVVILENNVSAITNAVTKDGLVKAALAGGMVIERQAKINIERTFSSKSLGGAGLGGSVQTVVSKSSAKEAQVDVGPTVIYGRIQELGGIVLPVFAKMLSWVGDTGERIFANKVQIPARPYLRPAVDEHRQDIEAAVGFQIKKQIESVAK